MRRMLENELAKIDGVTISNVPPQRRLDDKSLEKLENEIQARRAEYRRNPHSK